MNKSMRVYTVKIVVELAHRLVRAKLFAYPTERLLPMVIL